MDMTGEYRIRAPRDRVWAALNDPAVLKACIPGCEEINKLTDTEMDAVATVALGPVKAKFKGKVRLSDLNPPESYTLTGEGQGGAAGFAKGEARVKLTPEGDGTILTYAVKANIGGRLAQMGQRLIDGAAKKMADDFFAKFAATAGGTAAIQPATAIRPPVPPKISGAFTLDPPLWIPIAIAVLAFFVATLTLIR